MFTLQARILGKNETSERLDVSKKRLTRVSNGTASMYVLLERQEAMAMLEETKRELGKQGGYAITTTSQWVGDEAAMPVRAKNRHSEIESRRALTEDKLPVAGTLVKVTTDDRGRGEGGDTRVFNQIWRYGVLYKLGDEYISLIFSLCVPLIFQSDKTSETYYDSINMYCLDLRSCVPDRGSYPRRQRLCTSDGDFALARAERAHANLFTDEAHQHKTCIVHRITNRKKEVFKEQVPQLVSFLVDVNLTFKTPVEGRTFRKEISKLLGDPARVMYMTSGVVPHECKQLLFDILQLFLAKRRGRSTWRRAVVETHVHGIRVLNDGRVILMHNEAVCRACSSEAACLTRFKTDVARALCPRCPRAFPCRQWTGCEESLDFVGLLSSFGLFRQAFTNWCARRHGETLPAPLLTIVGRVADPEGAADDAGALAIADAPLISDTGAGTTRTTSAAQSHRPGDLHHGDAALAVAAPDWAKKREEQKQRRKQILKTIATPYRGMVASVRQCMEPWRAYVSSVLFSASEREKRKQLLAHQDAAFQGVPDFPVLIAWKIEAEKTCLAGIRARLHGAALFRVGGCFFGVCRCLRMVPPTSPNHILRVVKHICYVEQVRLVKPNDKHEMFVVSRTHRPPRLEPVYVQGASARV